MNFLLLINISGRNHDWFCFITLKNAPIDLYLWFFDYLKLHQNKYLIQFHNHYQIQWTPQLDSQCQYPLNQLNNQANLKVYHIFRSSKSIRKKYFNIWNWRCQTTRWATKETCSIKSHLIKTYSDDKPNY